MAAGIGGAGWGLAKVLKRVGQTPPTEPPEGAAAGAAEGAEAAAPAAAAPAERTRLRDRLRRLFTVRAGQAVTGGLKSFHQKYVQPGVEKVKATVAPVKRPWAPDLRAWTPDLPTLPRLGGPPEWDMPSAERIRQSLATLRPPDLNQPLLPPGML